MAVAEVKKVIKISEYAPIIGQVIVGILALIGTLAGSYWSNQKHSAVMELKIEQLSERVNQHNHLIERTYRLEESDKVTEEKIKVINNRLADLERGCVK